MQELINWLDNPERTYEKGCLILKKHSLKEAAFFLSVKEPDPESYHFRMMINKLQNTGRKLSQNKQVDVSAPVVDIKGLKSDLKGKAASGPVIVSNPIVDFKELPAVLQEKFLANKSLTQSIARFHVQMKAAVNDEVRKTLVNDIAEFEGQKAENWAAIDHWWKENKTDKVLVKDIEADQEAINKEIAEKAVARVRRIDTLKINIARAAKEVKSLTGKKESDRIAKIEKWNIELADLEKEG